MPSSHKTSPGAVRSPGTYQSRPAPSKHHNSENSRQKFEAKAQARYTETKAKQNNELLLLLDKEQSAEAERAVRLAGLEDAEEREKVDNEFGVERAKASERIVRMSEAHERNLKKLVAKLGIKPPAATTK